MRYKGKSLETSQNIERAQNIARRKLLALCNFSYDTCSSKYKVSVCYNLEVDILKYIPKHNKLLIQ